MSTMLEQAIVDAEALKEAAVKNAETLVLEKYSNQIKGAVETLLEQEEGENLMADLATGLDETPDVTEDPVPEEESAVLESIPLAVTSEDDSQVEIPLDALYEEITRLSETMRFDGDFVDDAEIQEYSLTEVDVKSLEEMLDEEDEDTLEEMEKADDDEVAGDKLDDDLVEEIAEALKVDLAGANKTGWLRTPQSEIELAEEELLALEQDSEIREKNAAMRKAAEQLQEANKSLAKSKQAMIKLRNAVLILNEKLQGSSLDNAKLLYQNKALNSDSMNERQKHKLVESISSAESIEEAKVIFETLNNTVGSTSRKSQPNSLSEAVQKTSSMILSSRKKDSASQKSDPAFNRWKFLAGIDKN